MTYSINSGGQIVEFDEPKIMGILNITEHSFYDGGKYNSHKDKYIARAEQMIEAGAHIIDIGCMATNPNAPELSQEQELHTVEEVLKNLLPRLKNTIFSLDTWRSKVATLGVQMGVHIINDISGGDFDKNMFETIANLHVPYILTHTSGKPNIMQQNTDYEAVTVDVFTYLNQRLNTLRLLGVADVIIDPGYGFGKTILQNYELLKRQELFKELGCPILAGLSRKSLIYKLLDIDPQSALNATTVVNTIALLKGANILRVHDVKEAVEVVKIVKMVR
ncbi:MAG: dihydropteroate synthase [Bacteroidales bacterium]|jgi:dihydropteroate synthase|nr:dihydropteroate synthase [Bacteroidales bacterium]